jgi:triacylglycerol lipase
MMWMSQLAYDTDDRPKVESVLDAWSLGLRAFVTNNPITGFPLGSACVVVAGGRGATIVSFAGTDPLKVSDWHTDLSALPSPDGLHRGFANALDSAWSPIEGAIAARPNTEQALFFTGHSLGGALALIAQSARHAILRSTRGRFPPPRLFRHVGRLIQCDSGRLFTSQTPMSDHDKRQTREG